LGRYGRDPFDDPFFKQDFPQLKSWSEVMPPKKTGFGCLGAGCAVLFIDALLFVGAAAVIAVAVKWVMG
jgi:hypothetical protein